MSPKIRAGSTPLCATVFKANCLTLRKSLFGFLPQNTVLRNGSETFDSWRNTPLPVYTQFYFFNVTNPEEILRGETPQLEEVGPYTYR